MVETEPCAAEANGKTLPNSTGAKRGQAEGGGAVQPGEEKAPG